MTEFLETPNQSRSVRAASITLQLVGGLILLAAAWQSLYLLIELGQRATAETLWLRIAAALPFLALCLVGGGTLVRRNWSGCWPIYAAGWLSLFRWPVPAVLSFHGWHLQPLGIGLPISLCPSRLQLINGAVLLLLVVLHRRLVFSQPPDQRGRIRFPWRFGLVLTGILSILTCKFLLTRHFETAAATILEHGIQAFEAGQPETAIQHWDQIVGDYPDTRSWGMALYNKSHVLRQQQRWQEAIPLLDKLLASELRDTDPSPNLMRPYQNYHHEACLALVDCHEQLHDYPTALRHACLARDTYPLQSWCGTCAMSSRQYLQQIIARLEQKIAGTYIATTDDAAGHRPLPSEE